MYSPCNVPYVLGIFTIIIHTHRRITIKYNHRSFLWNCIWILVQQFMNLHPEMCKSHSCSACNIVLNLCTWLRNWSWNMCAMVNWPNSIKYNLCSCASDSVWTIFPTRTRESHQLILILDCINRSDTGA